MRASSARSAETSGRSAKPRWTPPIPPVPMKRIPASRGRPRACRRRSSRRARPAPRRQRGRAGRPCVRPGRPRRSARARFASSPTTTGAVEHTDRCGHGSFGPDRRLRLEPHLHPHPGWEPVCDERSLERHDRAAVVEGLLHFRRDSEQIGQRNRSQLPDAARGRLEAELDPADEEARPRARRPRPSCRRPPRRAAGAPRRRSAVRTSTPREPRFTTAVSASA